MAKLRWRVVVAALTMAAASLPAGAAPAASAPAAREVTPAALTDAMVSQAIQRGLKYLYAARKEGSTWETQYDRRHAGGVQALVLLTALTAGENPQQPVLAAAVKELAGQDPQTTYVRAMRIMVYARLPADRFGDALKDDVAALAKLQMPNGGWGYGTDHPTTKLRQDWTDASNSQMAILAMADAAAAGAAVKPELWIRVRDYWEKSQNPDGGWGYEPPGTKVIRLRGTSHGSMTAAGLASYLLIAAQLAAGGDDKKAASPAVALKAIDWLGKTFSVARMPGWVWSPNEEWVYFYLWKLSRAAGLCGLRTFGTADWYPQMAALLLTRQRADGGWSEPALYGTPEEKSDVVRTCFALLALLRGSAPLAVARLGGSTLDNANFLDASNFAAWLSASRKQLFSWQHANPTGPASTWSEAPVLYIAASAETDFDSLPGAALSDFLLGGGSVLVSAAGKDSAQKAAAYFTALLKKYDAEAAPLPASHPIWSVYYTIEDKPAGVIGIGDAARTRVFIVPEGLAEAFHHGASKKSAGLFELAGNLVFYTTDLAMPGRLAARKPAPARRPAPPKGVLVARVRHAGGWSACPLALPRLGDVLADALSFGVVEDEPVDLTEDVPPSVTILWMTGTGDPGLTADKLTRLKKFLGAGGTLFIDSTIGAKAFSDAVESALKSAFGSAYKDLPATHAVLTGEVGGGAGCDVREVKYTPEGTRAMGGSKSLKLYGVELNGRFGVIFSKVGITCGVDGSPIYGAVGLASDDARRLAANVVLYALLGE